MPDPEEDNDYTGTGPSYRNTQDRGLGQPAQQTRVAQAQKPKPKVSSNRAPTRTIYVLFYLPRIANGYGIKDLLRYLRNVPSSKAWDSPNPDDPFLSTPFVLKTSPKDARSDLAAALNEPGAIVIYFGHAVLTNTTTLGLRPNPDPNGSKYDITNKTLVGMLKKASAKAVILEGCDTKQCVGPQKGDLAIIATDSGKDRLTWSQTWAQGLAVWLNAFADGKNISDCTTAANSYFKAAQTKDPKFGDRFVLVSGDGSMAVQ